SWKDGDLKEVPSCGSQSTLLIELLAVRVLSGAHGVRTPYQLVERDFVCIGPQLGSVIGCNSELSHYCFSRGAGPLAGQPISQDYSWVTLIEAKRLLYGIKISLGQTYFKAFKRWLASRPGISADVQKILLESVKCPSLFTPALP